MTQSYQYDHLNRLNCANEAATSAVTCGSGGSNWTQTYGQDILGNNWFNSSTGTGLPTLTSETPQSSGSFTTTSTTTAPNQVVGWTYDFNGNLIQEGSVTRGFTYDVENRQVTANMNGTVSSYVYDGDGQRVSKTVGSVTTTYVYDAFGNEAAEYITTNDVSPCGTPTCFVVEDHLGSTRMLTDSNGSGVRRYDYLPFGQELSVGAGGRTLAMGYLSAPDGVSPKFTGQDRDAETGSDDWFQVRYMDGAQGRFQSVDPGNAGANLGDPQSWNGYGYVGNNPLSYTDPSGMATANGGDGGGGGDGSGAAGGLIVAGIEFLFHWVSGGGGPPPTISSSFVRPSAPLDLGVRFFAEATAHAPNACNNQTAVAFVKKFAPDAAEVARPLGVPAENILGLSAAESGYGRDWNATKKVGENGPPAMNFFSLQGNASAPYANGSITSGGGTSLSAFPSYLASARSFAAQYGSLVMGKVDPTDFAKALVPRFNPGKLPRGDPAFASKLAGVIGITKTRMGCPQ